jgi:hypothetical protein
MAFAPSSFLGAARIAYASDDAISAPAVEAAPAAPAADPAPAAAVPASPASVLYPEGTPAPAAAVVPPVTPVVDPAAVVADPVADPAAGADDAPDVTGLSPEDAAAVKEAWEAKQAAKVARKAELDAMSPEDRATAEAADAEAEAEEVRLNTIPEDGVYDLRMPDGVALDADLLAAVSPDLAALALNNGQAQQLANTFIKAQQAASVKASEEWAKTLNGWVDTAKADPEIGGPKWDATVKNATRAIGQFGSPALKEYLEHSGGGNHAEMIRAWAKVGAAIGEDNTVVGDPPGKPTAPTDSAAVLYPNDTPKGK